MKRVFLFILIISLILGCKPEEKMGVVGFEVWLFGSLEEKAKVSIYKDGKLIGENSTDLFGRVSFLLLPGEYVAIGTLEHPHEPVEYSSDSTKARYHLTAANGPLHFTVAAGEQTRHKIELDQVDDKYGTAGWLRVVVKKFNTNGPLCGEADIGLAFTQTDAVRGQFNKFYSTQATGTKDVYLRVKYGEYFLVADWYENGVHYTSDTTRVYNFHPGPPPNSEATGPNKARVLRGDTTELTIVVDYHQ